MVWPFGKQSIMRTPWQSQTTEAVTLLIEGTLLNFFGGENRHASISCSGFWFRDKMMYPCLILGHSSLMKIGWIRLKASQKFSWNFKTVNLLVWCQRSAYPSGRLFTHPQDFCQSSMKRPDTDAQTVCLTVTCLAFIRWIPSTCASVVADFGSPVRTSSSVLSFRDPLKITSPLIHSRIAGNILNMCFDHIIMDFPGLHWSSYPFLTALDPFLSNLSASLTDWNVSSAYKKKTSEVYMMFCFTISIRTHSVLQF